MNRSAQHHRFPFFQVICTHLPVTSTFSLSPEGLSYRDSTVFPKLKLASQNRTKPKMLQNIITHETEEQAPQKF